MIYVIAITIVIGFIILYYTIKAKNTQYKYEEVFVLKNEITTDWTDGVKKPFNLIGDIPGLRGDRVYIMKKTKIVFGEVIKKSFSIKQSYMSDDDSY